MQRALRDLKDYQHGDYAPYRHKEDFGQNNAPAFPADEQDELMDEEAPEEIDETSQQAEKKYALHLGDEVHIGADTFSKEMAERLKIIEDAEQPNHEKKELIHDEHKR